MHFSRILLVAIGAAILLPSALAQTAKCPTGQREHEDDNGKLWCIDSEGRSFEAPVAPAANNAPITLTEKQDNPVLDTVEAQAAEDAKRGFKLPSCSGWDDDKRSHEEMYHGAVGAFNAKNYDTAYCMAISSYDSKYGPLYSPAQTLLGLLYSKKRIHGL